VVVVDDMSHRLDKLEESLRFDNGGRDSAEAEGRNSSGPQQQPLDSRDRNA